MQHAKQGALVKNALTYNKVACKPANAFSVHSLYIPLATIREYFHNRSTGLR